MFHSLLQFHSDSHPRVSTHTSLCTRTLPRLSKEDRVSRRAGAGAEVLVVCEEVPRPLVSTPTPGPPTRYTPSDRRTGNGGRSGTGLQTRRSTGTTTSRTCRNSTRGTGTESNGRHFTRLTSMVREGMLPGFQRP